MTVHRPTRPLSRAKARDVTPQMPLGRRGESVAGYRRRRLGAHHPGRAATASFLRFQEIARQMHASEDLLSDALHSLLFRVYPRPGGFQKASFRLAEA